MEASAVLAKKSDAMGDGAARTTQNSGGLAMRDLGDEGTKEAEVELGLLEAVVDSEGLCREGAAALEAQEALNDSAVARAQEVTLEAPAVMAG
jgi:hypothetical protein